MDLLTPSLAGQRSPQQLALIAAEESVTFETAAQRARWLAAWLRQNAEPDQLVCFEARPSLATVNLVWALLEANQPFVPLHPRWTEAERTRALQGLGRVLQLSNDRVSELFSHSKQSVLAEAASFVRNPTDLLCVLLTSGSSGQPKGVLLTRGNFLASAHAHQANLPFLPEDRWLLGLPFAHAGGLSILTRALASNSTVVLADSFDPAAVLASIVSNRVTLLSVVPTMLSKLLELDHDGALGRLRAILVGGAAFPAALRDACVQRKLPVLSTYGLTESCSQVATHALADAQRLAVTDSGRPLAGFDLRIVRANGEPAAVGEVGSIELRGEALFRGYLHGPPRAPGAAFVTGDLGSLDESGRLTVVGRADDLIITGGENVHPAEVEDELSRLAGVKAVVVFGVSDATWGQLVAAAFVLEPGVELAQVVQESRSVLASFRRVRRACAVAQLPVNATGKVSRKQAAELLGTALVPVERLLVG